jgi:hypothetical protein
LIKGFGWRALEINMPTNVTRFRLNDIVRAKRAAIKAGLEIGALEIDSNGTIRIVPKAKAADDEGLGEWDGVR